MPGTVLVLGGGMGGVTAARSLRKHLPSDHRVVLVDRDPVFTFAPSLPWVMTGERRPDRILRDRQRLRRRGIEVVIGEAGGLDTDRRTVRVGKEDLRYDRLIIALGADLAPESMPGFEAAAINVYTTDGAAEARRALHDFDGGRVAVIVSRLPYKCPAAPNETAFLAEAILRKRGVRDGSHVALYTPEPFPMPTAGPALGNALASMLEARGIELHTQQTIERIDPDRKQLVLGDGARADFDLLLGIPPHRAGDLAGDGGLAAQTGFIPVDRNTLATSADGVYAIGDVAQIALDQGKFLPKAGVFAEAQAKVVARRIAGDLLGRGPEPMFDGKGSCFVEMGDGVTAFATGDFYAKGAPAVSLRRPGRRWHLAKVLFEQYWLRRWM